MPSASFVPTDTLSIPAHLKSQGENGPYRNDLPSTGKGFPNSQKGDSGIAELPLVDILSICKVFFNNVMKKFFPVLHWAFGSRKVHEHGGGERGGVARARFLQVGYSVCPVICQLDKIFHRAEKISL
jgi:hypothetical protein